MADNNSSERISQKLAPASEGGVKGKKRGLLIGISVVIIIAALVGIIVYLVMAQGGGQQDIEKRNTVVTPDNVDQVMEEMSNAEYVEPGYYTATMTNEWHFATGDAVSEDAYVENVPENTNDVYFDIVLEEDENNVIYKSPVIPKGSRLENIALDTKLDAGTYNCVMIYHLIDDEQNTVSTLRVTVKVIVEG